MRADLKNMSGEQLLLVSIFDGAKVQDTVDRELDRRALSAPVYSPRWFGRWAIPVPRNAA